MSGNYRRFFPKIFSFIRENLNRNDLKFIKPNLLSTCRTFVKDSKYLVTIKSAYSRLGSALYSDIDFSIDKFTSIYDRISGRDSVTKAHGDLLQAEQDFVARQLTRRTLQQSLFDIQKRRSEVNKKVKVTSIADDSYLPLITKEHELAREEARLSMEHCEADLREKAAYDNFTSLMRYLHAEERNYDQRMRIWALIGSVIVGIFSFFVTWLRYRTPQIADISNSLDMMKEIGFTQEEIRSQLVKLNENLSKQQVDASQVLEKLTKVESIQEYILSALKKCGAASLNVIKGNNTEESFDFKRSDEEEATGYFGWKSIIGTVATIAVIAICLI